MEEGIETTGRRTFDLLQEILEYHEVPFKIDVGGSMISVSGLPGQTFELTLEDDGTESAVSAPESGWHYHFDNPTDATSVFMFLLVGTYEVITTRRGEKFYSSFIRDSELGKKAYQTIVGFPNPFKKATTQVYRNQVVVNLREPD